MKKITILALVCIVSTLSAQASLRFGVKGGVNVNRLHLNKEVFNDVVNSDNRLGFTGGVMVEFTLPVVGLGIDASALYARRTANLDEYSNYEDVKRDYLTFPVNLKYKISLPVVGKFITPFATTGPEFSFLINDNFDKLSNMVDGKKMSTSWNVGFGLEVMNRVQIHANYCIGLTKALETVGITNYDQDKWVTRGKDRYWTVTAAYMF